MGGRNRFWLSPSHFQATSNSLTSPWFVMLQLSCHGRPFGWRCRCTPVRWSRRRWKCPWPPPIWVSLISSLWFLSIPPRRGNPVALASTGTGSWRKDPAQWLRTWSWTGPLSWGIVPSCWRSSVAWKAWCGDRCRSRWSSSGRALRLRCPFFLGFPQGSSQSVFWSRGIFGTWPVSSPFRSSPEDSQGTDSYSAFFQWFMTKKEVPLSKNLLFIAERQGFEPWEQLPVHRISSAARSTTPASFLIIAAQK